MKCFNCNNHQNFKSLKPEFCKTENYLCLKCGLVFIPNRSSLVKRYYKDDGYFKKSINFAYRKNFISKSLLVEGSKQRVNSALEILSINFRNKKVLDIGCGYGEILYFLKKNYHAKVEGIEASPQTAQFGSKMFGVSVYPKLLEEFETNKKYDVILCSHVLEHVYDPNIFLKLTKKLLKKDGLFYIEVPNILKPTGGYNLEMFLYREHLQTFSAYNLYLLLQKQGFGVIAYSDKGFLKFWCQISKEKMKVDSISAKEILEFLKRYKKEYNYINFSLVYIRKLLYGGELLVHKFRDLYE